MPIKLGNIRENRLKDIWNNLQVLREMRSRNGFIGCGECKHRYVCGGCRARAYAYFGDAQAPDPDARTTKNTGSSRNRGKELRIPARRRFFLF